MKTCVDFILENDCPDPLICGINCASDGNIVGNSTKIIPFNNYGQYHLRVKTCLKKVHPQKLSRYSMVDQVACSSLSDYEVCNRWIPPMTFVPVALKIDTTYVQVDYCEVSGNGSTYLCHSSNPSPSTIYGNKYLFPPTFDVAQTSLSVCSQDSKCLISCLSTLTFLTRPSSFLRGLPGQLLRHQVPPGHLLPQDPGAGDGQRLAVPQCELNAVSLVMCCVPGRSRTSVCSVCCVFCLYGA